MIVVNLKNVSIHPKVLFLKRVVVETQKDWRLEMSPYWVLWLVLCIVVIKDATFSSTTKIMKYEFYFIFAVMSLALIWRYGQGTDYFGYYVNYLLVPEHTISFPNYGEVHGELGWLFLCNLFRVIHAPYELFVALVSAMQMWCLFLFMNKYCVESPMALMLSIPSLYFIYFMSGLRQGCVIAVLLGILLPLLEERKYFLFYIIVILCITIHSVACVFLFLPLVQWIRKTFVLLIMTAAAWMIGILFTIPIFQQFFLTINIGSLQYYLSDTISNVNFSIMAIAERVLLFLIVTFLYYRMWKSHECNGRYSFIYRCYLVAVASYGLLSWNGFIASRTMAAIQFVEIHLIVTALKYLVKREKCVIVGILVVLNSFMLFKNINAAILQGQYNNTDNYNYPYISIFESEKIFKIREFPKGWLKIISNDHPISKEIELEHWLHEEETKKTIV